MLQSSHEIHTSLSDLGVGVFDIFPPLCCATIGIAARVESGIS